MNPITTNYGLKGGTLDATKHLETAIQRLCSQGEIDSLQCRPGLQLLALSATLRGRGQAPSN